MLRPVVAVVGPTAAGKSELSLALAHTLGGEIVNADSMQLYQGMDIGTAKLTMAERRGIPHHLLDIWPVTQAASVSEYQVLARAAIADIRQRSRTPILVGGSGLYVRAALDKLEFPATDPQLRARLEAELDTAGAAALHARLAGLDPAAAAAILPGNGRRVVRALEVIELSGRPFSATMPDYESVYPVVQIGVAMPRPELDRRIAERVDRMWQLGLVDEVRQLELARASAKAGQPAGRSGTPRCSDSWPDSGRSWKRPTRRSRPPGGSSGGRSPGSGAIPGCSGSRLARICPTGRWKPRASRPPERGGLASGDAVCEGARHGERLRDLA